MELLLGIETVSSSGNLVGLCKVYDKIGFNVHSLEALGVSAESYGSLLSSLLLKRLPAKIRLLIRRKLLGEWLLKEIMVMMEEELHTREHSGTLFVKDGGQQTVNNLPTASALLSTSKSESTSFVAIVNMNIHLNHVALSRLSLTGGKF